MRIAYLILAHKNPDQVKRLVNLLNGDVYIHIDSKCDIKKFYISNEKINYINKRISINWGGFSMVQATLRLINDARKSCNYDYYVLLSGDDYPIRNLNEFELFLDKHKKHSFIEYDKFEPKWQHLKERYTKYKISESTHIVSKILQKILNIFVNNRAMFRNMQAYKGAQWWCLNSDSINYILRYISDNKGVIRYFKHTYIPDEMFFQVILLNSHLKNRINNNNLRYILLKDRHPEILTINNLNDLINTKNKFFARKFDIEVDSEVLDLLDNRMDLKSKYFSG